MSGGPGWQLAHSGAQQPLFTESDPCFRDHRAQKTLITEGLTQPVKVGELTGHHRGMKRSLALETGWSPGLAGLGMSDLRDASPHSGPQVPHVSVNGRRRSLTSGHLQLWYPGGLQKPLVSSALEGTGQN